jgi:hypothetical protein
MEASVPARIVKRATRRPSPDPPPAGLADNWSASATCRRERNDLIPDDGATGDQGSRRRGL